MATILQGYEARQLIQGAQVIKAATAFPQTATGTLFTVAGGNVLVTSLIGQVTTVVQSSDPVLLLGTAPTAGTLDTDGIATSTTLASAEVGTFVGVAASSGLGGALVVGSLAGSALYPAASFVVAAGTITWTTGASKTGAMKWYLTYVPLDTGAYVS